MAPKASFIIVHSGKLRVLIGGFYTLKSLSVIVIFLSALPEVHRAAVRPVTHPDLPPAITLAFHVAVLKLSLRFPMSVTCKGLPGLAFAPQ